MESTLNYSRTEYFIAGAAVKEAGDLLALTPSGEAIISANCWNDMVLLIKSKAAGDEPFAKSEKGMWQLDTKDMKQSNRERNCLKIGSLRDGDNVVISTKNDYKNLDLFTKFLSTLAINAATNEMNSHVFASRHNSSSSLPYMEESLSKYIQTNIFSSLHVNKDFKNTLVYYNQIRVITSMFIRFPTLDVSKFIENIGLAQKLVSRSLQIVANRGGTCRQFGCDDKAATILLIWGMEGYSHERGEGVHVLDAALELQSFYQNIIGSNFSIGIASGSV